MKMRYFVCGMLAVSVVGLAMFALGAGVFNQPTVTPEVVVLTPVEVLATATPMPTATPTLTPTEPPEPTVTPTPTPTPRICLFTETWVPEEPVWIGTYGAVIVRAGDGVEGWEVSAAVGDGHPEISFVVREEGLDDYVAEHLPLLLRIIGDQERSNLEWEGRLAGPVRFYVGCGPNSPAYQLLKIEIAGEVVYDRGTFPVDPPLTWRERHQKWCDQGNNWISPPASAISPDSLYGWDDGVEFPADEILEGGILGGDVVGVETAFPFKYDGVDPSGLAELLLQYVEREDKERDLGWFRMEWLVDCSEGYNPPEIDFYWLRGLRVDGKQVWPLPESTPIPVSRPTPTATPKPTPPSEAPPGTTWVVGGVTAVARRIRVEGPDLVVEWIGRWPLATCHSDDSIKVEETIRRLDQEEQVLIWFLSFKGTTFAHTFLKMAGGEIWLPCSGWPSQ